MLKCLEFFSGIGGLHYGIDATGVEYEVIEAFDNNKHANQTYKYNHPNTKITSTNLEHLSVAYFEKLAADCWLLSPPCQPYTRGGKLLDDKDARAKALLHLIGVLKVMECPPRYLFVENVLNFECSVSRGMLVDVLAERGYVVREFLISPVDDQIRIPNNRLRYYLTARMSDGGPADVKRQNAGNEMIIRKLSQLKATPDASLKPRQISDFLRPPADSSPFLVPTKYLTDYKQYRHDIVKPCSLTSTTFTKAYASNYIIGTGSFLQTQLLDLEYEADDPNALVRIGLRFFTPTEIALLHGLLIDSKDCTKSFRFPPSITYSQQYKLLGNSLNVCVVTKILLFLFSDSYPQRF